MARLYLVRHAEPATLWGVHPDPGLSELGQTQALVVAGRLASLRGHDLISSPLARCRQTAVPLQALWGQGVLINRAVAEIPVPATIAEHQPWLMKILAGNWSDAHVDPTLRTWRQDMGDALLNLSRDTIIFTHFVAINAAVSTATGSDDVTVFKPGHASVTILESKNGALHVVELGQESAIDLA